MTRTHRHFCCGNYPCRECLRIEESINSSRIIALNAEEGKTALRHAKQRSLNQYINADIGIMFEYPEDLRLDEKVLNTKPKKYQITLKDETHKAYLFIENINREDTVWPTPAGDESKAAVVTFGANSGVEEQSIWKFSNGKYRQVEVKKKDEQLPNNMK
jgi:hypothetical protein